MNTEDDLRKRLNGAILNSDWKFTNHFELHDQTIGGDHFWLSLGELIDVDLCDDLERATPLGEKIGLVMDLAAWASEKLAESEGK